ncbi:hypothetical protein Hanom_Chr04g00321541 [Helianthus anomalus]
MKQIFASNVTKNGVVHFPFNAFTLLLRFFIYRFKKNSYVSYLIKFQIFYLPHDL